MKKYQKEEIIKVKVTGLQQYGAFVTTPDNSSGLIHISEISYGYVKKIEDFVNVGDSIYTEVLSVDNDNHLQLSIKDIDYKKDGSKLKRMAETKNGFEPLRNNLEGWISEKIKEVTDKM